MHGLSAARPHHRHHSEGSIRYEVEVVLNGILAWELHAQLDRHATEDGNIEDVHGDLHDGMPALGWRLGS